MNECIRQKAYAKELSALSENRFNDGDLLGGVAQRMQSFFDQSFAKEAAAPANANNNINNNHHMNQPGSGMNI